MASTTCGHMICELYNKGCVLNFDRRSYGIGGHPAPDHPPADQIARMRSLLDGLDRDAIRAELARQRLLADVAELVDLAKAEATQCLRTQNDKKIDARAAEMYDVIRDFTIEGES